MENSPAHPKFVRWALMLGIVVILNIFFSVVVSLAFPAPEFSTYCPQSYTAPKDVVTDPYATCQPIYQAAQDHHALYAFVLTLALGIVALIIGLLPLGSSIVSSGLSYGGVLAFIIGSTSYWSSAGNWIRLLITTIGLGALLYIGWKRFKD